MARLYLHCVICGRKQASGLLSGTAWAAVELPPSLPASHPAVVNGVARACPACIRTNDDWRERALAAVGGG